MGGELVHGGARAPRPGSAGAGERLGSADIPILAFSFGLRAPMLGGDRYRPELPQHRLFHGGAGAGMGTGF